MENEEINKYLSESKPNTGNLLDDELYKALDKLYERGWIDKHKGRDYDPRGTNEWQYVLDIFRELYNYLKESE